MSTFQSHPSFGYEAPRPPRTSLAAVFSLVLGILAIIACCIPFANLSVGVVAAILGIVALVVIAGSGGSVKGRGMATTGLILGVVGAALGLTFFLGSRAIQAMLGKYEPVTMAALSEDRATLQGALSSAAAARLTDEELRQFSQAAEAAMGSPVSVSVSWRAMFEGMKIVTENPAGPGAQNRYAMHGHQALPGLATFSNGKAGVLIVMDQSQQPAQAPTGAVVNIAIVPPGGGPVIWLYDPDAAPPGGP